MKPAYTFFSLVRIFALCALLVLAEQTFAGSDHLPSWNDDLAKQAIVKFVQATTDQFGQIIRDRHLQ